MKQPSNDRASTGAGPSEADMFAMAVLLGDPAIVRSAIEHRVNVNLVGSQGTPPIVLAVAKGHDEIAELLLAAGADVNAPDRAGGMTALLAAVTQGHQILVDKLIKAGANLEARITQTGLTALAIAVRKNDHAMIAKLLSAGANPNVSISLPTDPPDQRGITPLIYAASDGQLDTVRSLLRAGADPNQAKDDQLTPLMVAAFGGHLEVVQALVEARANVDAVAHGDGPPMTALNVADSLGHARVAEYLKRLIAAR